MAHLPLQQGTGLSCKHVPTVPWRICRAARLTLSCPASGDVLTSTKFVLILSWLCCSQTRRALGQELLPYSCNIWAQAVPGILCGKLQKRAVVTLLAKCCEEITGIHCYFHTSVTGETNSRHFEIAADVLWRLGQYGLRAKAKSKILSEEAEHVWDMQGPSKAVGNATAAETPLAQTPSFPASRRFWSFSQPQRSPPLCTSASPASKKKERIKYFEKRTKRNWQELRRLSTEIESNPL